MKRTGVLLLGGVGSSQGDGLADMGSHPDQREWVYM